MEYLYLYDYAGAVEKSPQTKENQAVIGDLDTRERKEPPKEESITLSFL